MRDRIVKIIVIMMLPIVGISCVKAEGISEAEIETLLIANQRHLSVYISAIECFSKVENRDDAVSCAHTMDQGFIGNYEKEIYGTLRLINKKYWDNEIRKELLKVLNEEKKYFINVEKCLPEASTDEELSDCNGPLVFTPLLRINFSKYTHNKEADGEIIFKEVMTSAMGDKSKPSVLQLHHVKIVKELPNEVEIEIKFSYLKNDFTLGRFSGDIIPDSNSFSFTPFSQINGFFLRTGVNIGRTTITLEDSIKENISTKELDIDLGFRKNSEYISALRKKIPYEKYWRIKE